MHWLISSKKWESLSFVPSFSPKYYMPLLYSIWRCIDTFLKSTNLWMMRIWKNQDQINKLRMMLEINSSVNFQSQNLTKPYLDKDQTKLSIVLGSVVIIYIKLSFTPPKRTKFNWLDLRRLTPSMSKDDVTHPYTCLESRV